jgi:hypothetical protein
MIDETQAESLRCFEFKSGELKLEETVSTNIFFTFCLRMGYNFAQDPFFNKCQRDKCVWRGVTFMGRRAGKMRKVTAQAFMLLSLVVWLE